MAQMAYSYEGNRAYQIGLKQSTLYLICQLELLPTVSAGKVPMIMKEILDMAESLELPTRRQRHYSRAVKKKPQRDPLRPYLKA